MPPSSQRALIHTSDVGRQPLNIRTLVHKRWEENVLLTDIRARNDEHFICTGRMPTAHPFFNDRDRTPRRDILFYTELGRQASLAVSHAFLGVNIDDVFIFEKSEAGVTDAIWRSPADAAPDSVSIEIKIRDAVRRKNNVVSRVIADHFMSVGDEPIFGGTGTWTVQSAALFQRLRKCATAVGAPASPLLPAGHSETRNVADGGAESVVISVPRVVPGTSVVTASLIVDSTHAYFFDHPCDHVPGMLLLEGCAQLALAAFAGTATAPPWRPAITSYSIDFTQFVECGLLTTLTATLNAQTSSVSAGSPLTVDIVISQRDRVAGTARLSVAFPC
jgi:2-oxo-3-(phosphooxy)propyl 3-oxoalkanoate synthase